VRKALVAANAGESARLRHDCSKPQRGHGRHLRVIVVGESDAGKISLINALLANPCCGYRKL
jgi:predicted GTPase